MALSQEILEDSEFAKTRLMNSNLDERCKKQVLRLLNVSMEATNGISVDEKIQKITETIYGLVILQTTFLDAVDQKIAKANKDQCSTCKAMEFVNTVESERDKQQIINEWKAANGISDETLKSLSENTEENTSWTATIKQILAKPWIWICVTAASISPYGSEIIKTIISYFSGGH